MNRAWQPPWPELMKRGRTAYAGAGRRCPATVIRLEAELNPRVLGSWYHAAMTPRTVDPTPAVPRRPRNRRPCLAVRAFAH
jgi:hypothetical protein